MWMFKNYKCFNKLLLCYVCEIMIKQHWGSTNHTLYVVTWAIKHTCMSLWQTESWKQKWACFKKGGWKWRLKIAKRWCQRTRRCRRDWGELKKVCGCINTVLYSRVMWAYCPRGDRSPVEAPPNSLLSNSLNHVITKAPTPTHAFLFLSKYLHSNT